MKCFQGETKTTTRRVTVTLKELLDAWRKHHREVPENVTCYADFRIERGDDLEPSDGFELRWSLREETDEEEVPGF